MSNVKVVIKRSGDTYMPFVLVRRLYFFGGFFEKPEWSAELLEDAQNYAEFLVDHLRKSDPSVEDYIEELQLDG